jgi:metal-dependent amidase/aminoacylase/carboxypeptidase family protein
MLRQHIKPYEIVTSLIKTDEGAVINVIVDKATLLVGTRSKTIKEAGVLREGVIKCCEGAAISTGCEVEFEET